MKKKVVMVLAAMATVSCIITTCQSLSVSRKTSGPDGTIDVVTKIEYQDWQHQTLSSVSFTYDDHGLPTGKAVPEVIERPEAATYIFEKMDNGLVVTVFDAFDEETPDKIWFLDGKGIVVREEKPEQYSCDYSYDEGRLINKHFKWSDWETEKPLATDLAYTYDGKGNLTEITSSLTGQKETFSYNDKGEITEEDNTFDSEALLGFGGFKYDEKGRMTYVEMYYYEDLDEHEYTYDDHGNITRDSNVLYSYETIKIDPADYEKAVNAQKLLHPMVPDWMFNAWDPLVFD